MCFCVAKLKGITMLKIFTHFKNARKVVAQIKGGEWDSGVYSIEGEVYGAILNGYRLWLANGPFFCDINQYQDEKCQPAFGLIFRHYVWWAAARKLKSPAKVKHIPNL